MKNILLATIICCLVQIVNAQRPGNSLKKLDLVGRIKEVTEVTFSDNNDQADTLNKDTLSMHQKRVIKFDIKGNAQSESYFESNGKISKQGIYKYNIKKNTITIEYFNYRNHLIDTVVHKYDKQGEEVESYESGVFGNPTKSNFYYDQLGNLIKKENYEGNVLNTTVIGKYDDKGQKLEEDFYSGEKLVYKVSCSYDESGNLINLETYDQGVFLGNKIDITYGNRDQNGNWQLKTFVTSTFSKNLGHQVSHRTTKRIIEYY